MKTLRIFLHFVFGVVNVLVLILFVAAAYSDRISPDQSILFSYLGLAFPVLCILNLCFMVYWLFVGEWRLILIGLASFLLSWGPVKHYFPFHGRVKPVPTENVIKVLTYNVMAFGYKNHTKLSPNKILKYIMHSGADVVCLQEYAESKSPKGLTAAKIYDALKMYPYRSVLFTSSSRFQDFGVAVFSKYPITNIRPVKYDSKYNGSSIQEIKIGEKKLTLINNHLESFKLTMEDRSRYSSLIKSFGSDGLDELRGAFEQKLGPAFRIRSKQAEAVAREIQKSKNPYVLVCGDFNDTPISYAHRTIQGDLVDAFAASGRGMGITYNRNLFWFRIDNILHTPNMTSMNCTVDKVKYSDHYPLWCYIRLEADSGKKGK